MSPFKALLDRMVFEKRLTNLYTRFGVNVNFKFLESPVSTWPNRPHNSWRESFESALNLIEATLDDFEADYFFASCGCYGIPICDYVYRKFNITSIYNGNSSNSYLGTTQNTNLNFMKGEINDSMRLDSGLGRIPGMGLIDGGRYVLG